MQSFRARILTAAVVSLSAFPISAHAIDFDGDGYEAPADCNESAFGGAGINPNAQEVIGDGKDQDCDGHDALDRKLHFNSFSPVPWPRTGAVTTVTDGVQIGNGVNPGSITRTVSTLVARGKVHAVVEVTSKTGAGACTVSVTSSPWPGPPGSMTDT